jgi:hypothetical protein
VLTVTCTVPRFIAAGLKAVIVVAFTTVRFVAGIEPKLSVEPLVKPVPVIVTSVPPDSGPADGLMLVIVGAAE